MGFRARYEVDVDVQEFPQEQRDALKDGDDRLIGKIANFIAFKQIINVWLEAILVTSISDEVEMSNVWVPPITMSSPLAPVPPAVTIGQKVA